jgi:general secretion pathway protein H
MDRHSTVAVYTRRAAPVPAAARGRGFTLLEILVVVFIIGIVLSLATLAFRDDIDDRLQTEARRLAALLTLASQEAVLQGSELAVAFTPRGYRFQVLEEGQWTDAADAILRERQLAEDLTLFVEIEGETTQPAEKDAEKQPPRVYLLSSGEITPFTLTLKHTNSTATYQLSGDFGGSFTFGP